MDRLIVPPVVLWYHRASKGPRETDGARFRHESRNAPEVSMWLDDRSVWRQQNLVHVRSQGPESGLRDELAKEHHRLGWLGKVSECASWSSHWSSGFEIIPQTVTVTVQ